MRMYYLKTICMPCLLGLMLDNIRISTGPYHLDGVHGNVARHLSSNHRLQNWWLFITFTQAPYFRTFHCILLSSAIVSMFLWAFLWVCVCVAYVWKSEYLPKSLTLLKIIVYTHRAQHECSPKSCGLVSHWLTEGVLAKTSPPHTHTVKMFITLTEKERKMLHSYNYKLSIFLNNMLWKCLLLMFGRKKLRQVRIQFTLLINYNFCLNTLLITAY